jgi:hypothetical protein
MAAAADAPIIAFFTRSLMAAALSPLQVVQNCCHSVPKACEFAADCCRLLAGEGVSLKTPLAKTAGGPRPVVRIVVC